MQECVSNNQFCQLSSVLRDEARMSLLKYFINKPIWVKSPANQKIIYPDVYPKLSRTCCSVLYLRLPHLWGDMDGDYGGTVAL